MMTIPLSILLPFFTGTSTPPPTMDTLVVGGGCFWCLEAVYQRIPGVVSVESGYAGGHTPNPTYEEVCSDTTGHAEVVRIAFDTSKTSYGRLLQAFWEAHDPTTLNRQGADAGTQYRSIILYRNEAQHREAKYSRSVAQAAFDAPIVTEIVPLGAFFKAEEYHQNYYRNNANRPYCTLVIRPKLEKLRSLFSGQQ